MAYNFVLKVCLVAGAALLSLSQAVPAQEGPGGLINPGRDCQTVLNCNFTRGGRYRGCVSSYSCRVCSFVPARCSIAGKRGRCQELRCSWGA